MLPTNVVVFDFDGVVTRLNSWRDNLFPHVDLHTLTGKFAEEMARIRSHYNKIQSQRGYLTREEERSWSLAAINVHKRAGTRLSTALKPSTWLILRRVVIRMRFLRRM